MFKSALDLFFLTDMFKTIRSSGENYRYLLFFYSSLPSYFICVAFILLPTHFVYIE